MYDQSKNSIFRYIVLLILLAGFVSFLIYNNGSRKGIVGLKEPVQTEAEGSVEFSLKGYDVKIDKLYEYDATALVVHTKDYIGNSIGDRLAPKDVALAWGSVAGYNELIDFHWRQSGRWVYWNTNTYEELEPIGTAADVDRQSSNNHLVPADVAVRNDIKKIRRGDIVKIKGYLINILAEKPDGSRFSWRSSTSREDSGDGACELIYVTSVEWIK